MIISFPEKKIKIKKPSYVSFLLLSGTVLEDCSSLTWNGNTFFNKARRHG